MAFSPNGQWVATAGGNTVALWDTSSGRMVVSFSADTQSVGAVAFSRDGRLLAAGGTDGTVQLREVPSGNLARSIAAHRSGVDAIAFAPEGQSLATAGQKDTSIKLWDVASGKLLRGLKSGDTSNVTSLDYSPDGLYLASGTLDNAIAVWDVTTGRSVRTLLGHTRGVTTIAFSPDGSVLASGSYDTTARLWDLSSGREIHRLAANAGAVMSVAFSRDGAVLATGAGSKGGSDKLVRLWDVRLGRLVGSLTGHGRSVESVAFSPIGNLLASGSWDGTAKLWDVATRREQHTLAGRVDGLLGLALDPSGERLAAVSRDNTVKLWQPAGQPVVRSLGPHPKGAFSVAFSPDGRFIASGTDDTVKLWDGATGRELPNLEANPTRGYFVFALAFSPNSRLLASGGFDYRVRIWDLRTRRVLRTLLGHEQTVYAIRFSPDGHSVATGSDDRTVKLWEVATGRQEQTLTGHAGPVRSVCFGPDGRTLISGSVDGTLVVWDRASGERIARVPAHSGTVGSLAFSPDGKRLASAGHDGTIKIWETTTYREVATLSGHSNDVEAVAFGSGGRQLTSASRDGSIRVWDAATGEALAVLTAMSGGDDWLVITPDGLFDGSARGTESLVAWRIGSRVFPADRFFTDYYAPGLLRRIIAGERPRPEIDVANLKLPPDVRITRPRSGHAADTARLSVSVEAVDQGGGVSLVRLYQNGKLVGELPGRPGPRSSYRFDVDLIAGDNVLTASALTSGRVESNDDQIRVTFGTAAGSRPTLHLLAVGINEYEDPSYDLGFARPDAAAIAEFFAGRGRLFRSVQPVRLFDRDATRANILQALARLAQRAQPEDVVLIYLAGHGIGLDQQFYFLPHEMRKEMDEDGAIRKYGIAATVLGDALHQTRALKQLLILDTCQSEAAVGVVGKIATSRGPDGAAEKAVKMLARSTGIYVIAASTRQQLAYEVPELGHGILTYALLSGLGAKGNPLAPTMSDGVVTVLSLLTYAGQVVPELTEKYHRGNKQYPNWWGTGMDFPLVAR